MFTGNSRVFPLSFWPLISRRSVVADSHVKDRSAMGNLFVRRLGLVLVILCLTVGIGLLYKLHHDVGIGAAILAAYGGLYWLYRKTSPFNQRERYTIVRYRGRPGQKKKFFS